MNFLIVTGMSGAGKSSVLRILEDFGYFCADNLPPSLISKFAEVCFRPGTGIENVALGIDIRGGKLFDELFSSLKDFQSTNDYKILFLDSNDDVLINRYKESRRSHPLAKNELVSTGISQERELLTEVKTQADFVLDTSFINSRQLRNKIAEIFLENKSFDSLMITVLSFGFKYGVPEDSDLVFDVRFLPNPFYIPELKHLTGNDKPVRDFVMEREVSRTFLEKLNSMLVFLLPEYISEGKNQLVISIGCTGGRHRSVTLATELYHMLNKGGKSVNLSHRDIDKDISVKEYV